MSISNHRYFGVLVLLLFLVSGRLVSAQSDPLLGEPLLMEEIAKWDISIAPDGATLPPGEGTGYQGKEVYEKHCLRCHGEGAEGGDGAPPLCCDLNPSDVCQLAKCVQLKGFNGGLALYQEKPGSPIMTVG